MNHLNPNLPPWILGALLMNTNVAQETIVDLASHENLHIRKYAVEHENCPLETQVAEALQRETWEH